MSADDSDDCIIINDLSFDMPRPLLSTSEGLVKQENDAVSHDKPFMTTVSRTIPKQFPSGSYTVHIFGVCLCIENRFFTFFGFSNFEEP